MRRRVGNVIAAHGVFSVLEQRVRGDRCHDLAGDRVSLADDRAPVCHH